jgi:hypothetical protein
MSIALLILIFEHIVDMVETPFVCRVVTDHFFFIAIPVAFKNKKRNAVAIAIAILPKDRGRGRDLFCDRH